MTSSLVEELISKGVKWVEVHFTDLAGYTRAFTASIRALQEDKLIAKLDGSSVIGFTDIAQSDLCLKPDLSTLAIIPWNKAKVRVIAEVYIGEETRFSRDPRYIAAKAVEYLKSLGYEALIGPEVEFMLFDGIEFDVYTPFLGIGYRIIVNEVKVSNGYIQRLKEAYHTPPPMDSVASIRDEIAEALASFGITVDAHHHEVAALGQVEINMDSGNVVTAADKVITLKYVARNIAAKYGKIAVFMPKPVYGDNGNGMHVHVSLWNGEKNLFYDPSDDYAELSQLARYFIGGLIEHGRALAALVAPTTNSYRRLVPGYEAPVYLVWSKSNRSAAIRIPLYRRGDEKGKRIEFRPPDPSCNPYLAFAAIVMAGLDGIKKKIDPGDPVDKNVYTMSEAERRALGIKELPRSLDEALDELISDHDFLKPVFDNEVIDAYIEIKRRECRYIEMYPNPIEVYKYITL